MKGHPWQIRMKEAGLSARELSALTGKHETTISRQFTSGKLETYTKTVILAWEMMDHKMKNAILSEVKN
ncbi:hypothetical protein GO013_13195 [Pseudodesulfovibrio sp. JC047]|uniref:helix-turn-helix domain-containing protein n=1 Tax=Pseudodesulfovibrio sp. JC047 TaxID=2683199 RepID=UPI0013D07B7E|nr:helix-turn-helix domain-containing protein [Pseudodesulfovibrio sp. JC047]NDV20366.1 hypothetical protein [Pseudodesulfovibrio sp. JC047]